MSPSLVDNDLLGLHRLVVAQDGTEYRMPHRM